MLLQSGVGLFDGQLLGDYISSRAETTLAALHPGAVLAGKE
jgi:hypothetical protein